MKLIENSILHKKPAELTVGENIMFQVGVVGACIATPLLITGVYSVAVAAKDKYKKAKRNRQILKARRK